MDIDHILAHHLLDRRLAYLFHVGPLPVYLTIHGVMLLVAAALVTVGTLTARAQSGAVSTGWANFFEMIIVYIRDEIVRPNLGERGDKYLPYFLTLFFFILTCNLLGLVPFGMTATSNVAVTGALAALTFLMIISSGIFEHGPVHFLQSFVPSGLPWWLVPVIFFFEVLGLFTKAFALCVRLFANMIAGHIAILVIISLIFLFRTLWLAPISIVAAAAVSLLEVFICFLQAYVFTLLTALFVGAAVNPQH
ncbi:MAG TPA: F0F1 ATP synthase subunit A [Elusimicrobiota bacterium]|nr:F0F1 ATP synthase subunit A [Elusimicrobiota bacterium]